MQFWSVLQVKQLFFGPKLQKTSILKEQNSIGKPFGTKIAKIVILCGIEAKIVKTRYTQGPNIVFLLGTKTKIVTDQNCNRKFFGTKFEKISYTERPKYVIYS